MGVLSRGWQASRGAGTPNRCLSTRSKKEDEVNTVHILGVHGAGMRPAAAVAVAQGYTVRGSDDGKPHGTDTHLQGLQMLNGRLKATDLPDVIVASSAVEYSHPDLEFARQHSVPILSRRQWFRQSLQNFSQVTVAGTHGKTTTTSMITYLLQEMGLKFPFLVGGEMPQLPLSSVTRRISNTRELMVVEADEYDQTFLGLSPMVCVLTNVGYDHVDQFRTQQEVDDSFALFLGRMRLGGVLLANGDDEGCRRVVKEAGASEDIVEWQEFVNMGPREQVGCKVAVFYGFNRDNDITLHSTEASWDHQDPSCRNSASWHSVTHMMWAVPEIRHEQAFQGQDQAFASHFEYHLQLLGDHNVTNAAAAVLASAVSDAMFRNSFSTPCEALSLGLAEVFQSLQQVSQHAHTFTGPHRRLECLKRTTVYVGMTQKSISLYDDYAHHPIEVLASLRALEKAHPGSSFWIVWEPITRSRLEHFLEDFVEALTSTGPNAKVIVGPMDISREEADPAKDERLLLELFNRLNSEMGSCSGSALVDTSWSGVNEHLLSLLAEEMGCSHESSTVVVFMGAAKVTHAAHAFAKSKELGGTQT